jgi:subtilisin family serine protease
MVEADLVESAEPNLVTSINNLSTISINGIDRWSYDLIRIKEARQELTSRGKSELQYGHPSIVIAIMDTGIPSIADENGNITAKHPAFNGTIDGNITKITNFFDFVNVVANNNACTDKHGIACAGIASASKLNDDPFSIVPNCRIMALRYPEGRTTVNFVDAFLWTAGFDPETVNDHCNYMEDEILPPHPDPPADIISNSYQHAFGDASCIYDVLTFIGENGRDRKGTLLFFAAGNDDEDIAARDVNILARHPYSLTISASTIDENGNEKRSEYSNFGKEIFACAPSDNRQNAAPDPVHSPPASYAISTCDESDYRNNFGGTSASAPIIAGIAGLLLSIDSELTRDQIRQILKKSCIKIDENNYEVTFRWSTEEGLEFSQAYGYGRIDALAAVKNLLDSPA